MSDSGSAISEGDGSKEVAQSCRQKNAPGCSYDLPIGGVEKVRHRHEAAEAASLNIPPTSKCSKSSLYFFAGREASRRFGTGISAPAFVVCLDSSGSGWPTALPSSSNRASSSSVGAGG